MDTDYLWYQEISSGTQDLEQGDFIKNCPVFVPEYSPAIIDQADFSQVELQGHWDFYDAIVASQSCDLLTKKIAFVVLCPYFSQTSLAQANADFGKTKTMEDIRRGYMPSYHMLNSCDILGLEQEISIIEFKSAFTLPFHFLTDVAKKQGKRLRLRSPYLEQMSQAFGRFFMRVALPTDIPRFIK